MSNRLNVMKRRVVEYGESAFNWDADTVNPILAEFCEGYQGDCDECFEGDVNIEIPRESYEEMLEQFAEAPDIKALIEERGLKLTDGYTGEEFYKALKRLFDDADPSNDYIFLAWW